MPETAATEAIRVAVATKDRNQVDLHFGHADDFAIYSVGPAGAVFEETRTVEHYCQGGHGDEDKREVILRVLADCAALFVARIGNGPKDRLASIGVASVDDYPFGAVEASLLDWYGKRA
jgi:nitrogen fixation protein NifB